MAIQDACVPDENFEKRLNTKEAVVYLEEECGVKTTEGTMKVLRSQGRGAEYAKVGNKVYYWPTSLKRFAKGRVVKTVDSIHF